MRAIRLAAACPVKMAYVVMLGSSDVMLVFVLKTRVVVGDGSVY